MTVLDLFLELGVALPAGGDNRAVRCFANPQGHRADDRNASCSVSVITGAWYCHGCGARGGAYGAALAMGLDERRAAELCERRGLQWCTDKPRRNPAPWASTPPRREPARPSTPPAPLPTEQQVTTWTETLAGHPVLLDRIHARKGWTAGALIALEVGWDGSAFTIPIRDAQAALLNVIRYIPGGGRLKSRALAGRPRDLFPAPERIRAQAPELFADPGKPPTVLLVEGEPDAISAQSLEPAQYAVALPGARWNEAWASRFAHMHVVILTDHDEPGARTSEQAHASLRAAGISCSVLGWPQIAGRADLADGYDLGDWLLERNTLSAAA